jgi:glycosyltransferase 2 family protein
MMRHPRGPLPRVPRGLTLALRVLVPLLALAVIAYRFGIDAFRPALQVVSPLPLLVSLVLGAVIVAAQAARWRVVMHGVDLPLQYRLALAECYRSSALNVVMPGGVAGDVLRAWRQRTGAPQGWRPGAGAVLAERAAGVCLLLAAAGAVLALTVSPPLALLAAVGAVVAWLVARPSMRRLSLRDRAAVWGWSALALAAMVSMTGVVALSLGVSDDPGVVAAIGLALLAGMAVPLNLGGWGPREAAGALAAALVGASPSVGVAFAAGYGLLVTVSVLPGFLLLGGGGLSSLRASHSHAVPGRGGEVQLDTDVVAQDEAPGGHPERVRQPVPAVEPQPRDAIPDQQRRGGDE